MINQPIEVVVAAFSGRTSYRPVRSEDPSFGRVAWALGRRVEVRYTCFPIPGGTQVSAIVGGHVYGRFDPVGAFAVAKVTRRIEDELRHLKDCLE
jgi:hypothetical protein